MKCHTILLECVKGTEIGVTGCYTQPEVVTVLLTGMEGGCVYANRCFGQLMLY